MNHLFQHLLLMLLIFAATGAFSQQKTSIMAQAGTLKQQITYAATIGSLPDRGSVNWDTLDALNDKIMHGLEILLTDKGIRNHNIKELLKTDSLQITHSPDKRLWIFGWPVYTSRNYVTVLYYLASSGKTGVIYETTESFHNGSEWDGFCGRYSRDFSIYKLRNQTKDLYLVSTNGASCKNCRYNIATVIELLPDTISFKYPAFKPGKNVVNDGSCYFLDTYEGDLQKFDFDPVTQTLTIGYYPSELNHDYPADYADNKNRKLIAEKITL